MNRKIIKKTIFGIVSYLVLEGLFLKAISHIVFTDLQIIDVINIVGAITVIVITVKVIFFPYMIIQDGTITILRDFLYKEKVNISDILVLNVSDSPFSKSNFELRNKKKISFDSYAISKENLSYLEKLCKSSELT